jgi:hypothetical protein
MDLLSKDSFALCILVKLDASHRRVRRLAQVNQFVARAKFASTISLTHLKAKEIAFRTDWRNCRPLQFGIAFS